MDLEKQKLTQKEIDNLKDHKFFSEIIMKTEKMKELTIKNIIYGMVNEINQKSINVQKIYNLIPSQALSYQKSLRSLVWKISLKYLPLNIEEWESYLDKKRDEYQDIKDQYLTTTKN